MTDFWQRLRILQDKAHLIKMARTIVVLPVPKGARKPITAELPFG